MQLRSLSFALISVGCAAGSANPPEMQADAGPVDDVSAANVPLELEEPAPSTLWSSVAIHGRGPEGGLLRYGSDWENSTVDLPASGDFCVDVQLMTGVNRITFEAVSVDGRYSPQRSVEVRKQSAEDAEESELPIVNLIEGASSFGGNLSAENGTFMTMLTDGDLGSLVDLVDDFHSDPDWMEIPLAEEAPVTSVRIVTSEECTLEDYELWFAQDPDAEGPPHEGSGWTLFADVVDGAVDHEVAGVGTTPAMARFGLRLKGDACGWPWESKLRKVAEIQVFGPGSSGSTEERPPTCLGNAD